MDRDMNGPKAKTENGSWVPEHLCNMQVHSHIIKADDWTFSSAQNPNSRTKLPFCNFAAHYEYYVTTSADGFKITQID